MKRTTVFLKSFLTVFVWIPYALRLLNANITKKIIANNFERRAGSDSRRKGKLDKAEKRLAQILAESKSGISVFEFREVIERYAGLTLAKQTSGAAEDESELLRAANHKNVRLGTKCLARRNRLRLEFHQTLARRDFLKMLAKLSPEETKKLRPTALEFVTLLDDAEGVEAVEKLFAEAAQTEPDSAVRQGEIAVWKSREHKPLTEKIISTPLPTSAKTMTATINSHSKD